MRRHTKFQCDLNTRKEREASLLCARTSTQGRREKLPCCVRVVRNRILQESSKRQPWEIYYVYISSQMLTHIDISFVKSVVIGRGFNAFNQTHTHHTLCMHACMYIFLCISPSLHVSESKTDVYTSIASLVSRFGLSERCTKDEKKENQVTHICLGNKELYYHTVLWGAQCNRRLTSECND